MSFEAVAENVAAMTETINTEIILHLNGGFKKLYGGKKMKTLKKCFSLAGGRKSGLSFATFAICGIILLAVPLQISCSDSGDDNGDSTVGATLEGGRMIQILTKQGRK